MSNEKVSLNFRLGYNYFKTDSGRTHNVLAFGGADYAFSETMTLSGLVGLRYSDSKVKLYMYEYKLEKRYIYFPFIYYYEIAIIPHVEIKRSKDVGTLLNITFTKQMENGTFLLGIERNIIPSVVGEMIVRGKAYGRLSYKFSERWIGSISSSYYQGENTGSKKILDYYSYDVHPLLRFHLAKDIWLELAYLRQFYKSRLTDFKAERNVIFLGINWSKLYLWQ